MATTINGEPTKPLPASVASAMKKGYTGRQALARGPKPVSTVSVK
jgi:hypothetical protein